jgi:ABC-type transport system involved in multi-copper enzyme maturation permease subunit
MLRTLFYKEILEALSSSRFLIIFILCLIIVPLSMYVSTKDYQSRLNSYQESIRLHNESHKTIMDTYQKGVKAFRPPSSLSFLSLGLEIIMPNVAETDKALRSSQVELSPNNDEGPINYYGFIQGPLDMAFIVTIVMTFFAIVFSFGSVSGERESGTLKQILSNSVPRQYILFAKIGANYVALILPFLSAILFSIIIFHGTSLVLFGPKSIGVDLALGVIFSMLLIGVFLNLGVFVSSLTKQASAAAVILLLCWGLSYGIFPRLSVLLGQLAYPTKSQQLVLFEKDQARRENEKQCAAQVERLIDSDQYTSEKHDSIKEEYRVKLIKQWDSIDLEVEKKRSSQFTTIVNLARFSPVSCFVRPVAEISHTGWLQYQDYIRSVARFQDILIRQVYNKEKTRRSKGSVNINYEGNIAAAVPQFVFQASPKDQLILNILPDIILLVLYNLIFFAGTFVAFLRYDPR